MALRTQYCFGVFRSRSDGLYIVAVVMTQMLPGCVYQIKMTTSREGHSDCFSLSLVCLPLNQSAWVKSQVGLKNYSYGSVYTGIYTGIYVSPPSHPPIPPLLGHHRAPGWAPCVIQQLPTGYLFYPWYCIRVSATLSILPSLSLPHCVYKSIPYICIFIPALQIGSSAPFFQTPCMRAC